ncbi:MAG: class I SAM-dependent methyltransferase [Pseudomonadota bacterium]
MQDLGGYPPRTPGSGQGQAAIRRAYATYFESGHYTRRYPGPNPTVWRRVLRRIGPEARVIDYGCGSGRYLLGLQGRVAAAAGFDVSEAALTLLRASALAQGWDDLDILGPDVATLDAHVAREGPADLVLCLFGVIGHIADPAERAATLLRLRRAVRPDSGRLLISVPNAARRFRAEQRDAGDGPIRYVREMGDMQVALTYRLFTPAQLREELTEAGFRVERMDAESVVPESWLLRRPAARWLDAALTPLCPAGWGYGILAEASC